MAHSEVNGNGAGSECGNGQAREGQGWVEVAVADTGCGIPEADIPRLTQRFYRVDKARSRQEGGSGLGLSISKHIVAAHKGKIEVESKVGIGTKFKIRLPKISALKAQKA